MGIQWRTCAYTLRGIDIYSLRGSNEFISELGKISAGFHASPWGCLLENVFYGGFLPFPVAKVYFIVMNILILLLSSLILYRKTRELSSILGIFTVITSILSSDFLGSIDQGNAGGMICALLLIAWLICDKHEYLSGVLIGLAMVKPQDALIVCIFLLFTKRIKPLIVGAVVDVSAWFAVSVMTNRGMIDLLKDFLIGPNKAEHGPFAGIFTLVFSNFMPALLASMLFGVVFMLLVYKYLPYDMPEFFKAYSSFMAITLWCYSFENDCYGLILPGCICLYLMLRNGSIFWMLSSIYCLHGLRVRWTLGRILGILTNQTIHWHVHRSIYEAGIILLGIIICLALRRIYSEAKS